MFLVFLKSNFQELHTRKIMQYIPLLQQLRQFSNLVWLYWYYTLTVRRCEQENQNRWRGFGTGVVPPILLELPVKAQWTPVSAAGNPMIIFYIGFNNFFYCKIWWTFYIGPMSFLKKYFNIDFIEINWTSLSTICSGNPATRLLNINYRLLLCTV